MSIGKIGAFDVHKDNWDLYVERLGQYFVVNDVKPAVQVATLITVMGSEAYELLANLCSPDKPSTKEFDDLVAVMKKHLQPTRSTMAERFKFRQRSQGSDETIAEYTAELKKLTKDCDFQEASLNENLRDQFVCGIRNDSIRQKLFTEDNLTFERAFKMAVAMEAAESHAALVQDRSTIEEGVSSSMIATAVHQLATVKRDKRQSAEAASTERYGPRGPKVTQGDGTKGAMGAGKRRVVTNSADWKGGQTQQCSACGGQHGQSSCKFRAYVCRVCNKEGHLKKMCPNLRKNVSFHAMLEEQAGYQYSDSDSNGSEEVNNFSIDAKKLKKYGPYMVQLKVNNVNLVMEVDTGSAISCISYDCYSQLFPECPLKASNLNLCYYTDISVKPVGKILPSVQYNKKCKELDLYVMVNGKTSLLGRQWIKELGILPDLVKSVNCNNVSTKHIFDINDFSSRYCEVFEGGLGRFTGGTVGFRLREGAAPVFLRARPLAYALREPVERALDQLVADGVITPVNSSDWATPIVPVMKKDGTIRWNQECSEAFRKIKEILTSSEVLAHYSLDLPVVLTCDASSLGVGAVVSHITPDGERPVAYASRTLNAAEKGYSGCMVWGYRLVIPEVLREKLLRELHVGHMGIVKMKSMARSVMWWPGIDADVERTCKSCGTCVAESSAPPRAPPQPWRYLTDVWTRLHIDFLGPIQGRTFLILIDSTSKWLEVFQMQSTTAKAVIKVLRETFSRFGLPREVVSDNGPPFTSQEYKSFMTHNRVKVTFAAAYHPASNGAAEEAVKLCKRAIKKAMRDGGDIDAALQAYLLAYRNVEHSTTGLSPAELLQRRKLRSRLDLLKDGSVEDKVKERQTKQITYAGGTSREFNVGENVWYRNYSGGSRWLDGRIQEKTSSRNYIVAAENGSPIHRHVDQIKSRWMSTYEDPSPSSPTQESDGLRSERNDTSSVTVEDQCPAESGGAAVTAPSPPRSNTSESTDPPVNLPRPTLRPRDKLRSVKRYGSEID
ncbi:uncharacterized protein K02A2.6-like [Cydia pomonella]|uniref:uncharacterized protein K02A2.6-like n=1 Tax=Cydia pomonella TaxID=82600 RepID=UPI002ADE3131|nr:uncharacterized protein K02A2.6-like [Cydia pomonella]